MYGVLIRGERWIVLMLSPNVRDFKDNAVGNVEAETGRDLVFMTSCTTERSFNAVEMRGSTLT